MRVPKSLEALAHDGIIEEVLRPLMSGKEAQIYLVVAGGQQCAAKIYKDAQSRSFKNRADYTEGRRVRNSRDQRAIQRGTKYGKGQDESAWKSTEVEMIQRLRAAGVSVPTPYVYIDGVLVMELVTDDQGNPAPRLGDLKFSPEEARSIYHQLLSEVVRLLCAGVVHGDLSDFNVLLGKDGPVLIDFPQAVNAAQNQNARTLLLRDIGNLDRFLSRWASGTPRRRYGEEMWALYESNRLTPDTQLTGHFKQDRGPVDTSAVLSLIGDANRDEAARRRSRGQSTAGIESASSGPVGRRREVVVEKAPSRPGRGNGRDQGSSRGSTSPGSRSPRHHETAVGGRGQTDHGRRPQPPHARPSDRRVTSKPKRGDNVAASTYVSPEARKTKVLALTPRSEVGKAKPGEPDRRRRPPTSERRKEGERPGRGPQNQAAGPQRHSASPSAKGREREAEGEGQQAAHRRGRRRRRRPNSG
jgi:RIO kinase 1